MIFKNKRLDWLQFKRYLKIAKWTQKNLLRWKIYEIENFFKILTKSILMARYFLYVKITMWKTQRNLLRLKKFLKQKIVFKTLTKSILITRYFWYLKIAMWKTQINLLQLKKILKQKIVFKTLTKSILMARLIDI